MQFLLRLKCPDVIRTVSKTYPIRTFHCQQLIGAVLFQSRKCFESSVPSVNRSPVALSATLRFAIRYSVNIALSYNYTMQFMAPIYSNSLIHISSFYSHNNVASVQKDRGDKSHRVIVALQCMSKQILQEFDGPINNQAIK